MTKKGTLLVFICFLSCAEVKKSRYVPNSSGNINSVNVVMTQKHWKGNLGIKTRDVLGELYEGLPMDEPQYSFNYLEPKVFKGFARQSRNIILFETDSLPGLNVVSNIYANPQVLVIIKGKDSDEMIFYLEENAPLIRGLFYENERKEKLRRMSKSLSKENEIVNRFGIKLKYPSAYNVVKDTANFTWIQKQIPKGHLNLIVYRVPKNAITDKINESIPKIRDSIGRIYIPGRLKNSYMITEKAYRPYYYKTVIDQKKTYITKGTWEVANDFMAGPFVNYAILEPSGEKYTMVEGFSFAPSASKRDFMFELETIIKSINFIN